MQERGSNCVQYRTNIGMHPSDLTQPKGPIPQVYTLTACCRCRNVSSYALALDPLFSADFLQRKTRCDTGLPRCGPCSKSDAPCEYLDSEKGQVLPRSYVIHLQKRIQNLESVLAKATPRRTSVSTDVESTVRGAGWVRFREHDEPRILGPSSGITVTRLVMEFAKRNARTRNIKDIIPDIKAQQSRDRFAQEDQKPTSKVYPLVSNVAAPTLPTRELTESLVQNFNRKAQYLLPTFHEPSFRQIIQEVYDGDRDDYKNFTVRMVIAISMQNLDAQYAGLADSYYLAALPFLERSIRPMNILTLQCFALIAQYSMVTPTRTAAYWVVGLAMRLCQEMGITEEATLIRNDNGQMITDALEIDMRRRMFWIVTSMEMGLAHSLGRPSALGTTIEHIDVAFFESVDDKHITSTGVQTGAQPCLKKITAIHFLKMRLLQAEIRRKLYLEKRPDPNSADDPWFHRMEAKLEKWLGEVPGRDAGNGLDVDWFRVRYNTMVIFLHRPSPQIPEPAAASAHKCFDAAVFNIQKQTEELVSKQVDVTWIFTQSLYMALNTVLWTISYPEIRKMHSQDEVRSYTNMAVQTILSASERWPGVESAIELYDHLIAACLAAYGPGDQQDSQTESSSPQTSIAPPFSASTPGQSNSSTLSASLNTSPNISDAVLGTSPQTEGLDAGEEDHPSHQGTAVPSSTHNNHHQGLVGWDINPSGQHFPTGTSAETAPLYLTNDTTTTGTFDPTSFYNEFPSMQAYSFQIETLTQPDPVDYLGSVGDQWSQYLHAPYVSSHPVYKLDQDQQTKLMHDLESTGLGNMQ